MHDGGPSPVPNGSLHPLFNHRHELCFVLNSQIRDGLCWVQVMWRAADKRWMDSLDSEIVQQLLKSAGKLAAEAAVGFLLGHFVFADFADKAKHVFKAKGADEGPKEKRGVHTERSLWEQSQGLLPLTPWQRPLGFLFMINLSNCLNGPTMILSIKLWFDPVIVGEKAEDRVFKPIGKTAEEQSSRPHMHVDAQLVKKVTAVDRPKVWFLAHYSRSTGGSTDPRSLHIWNRTNWVSDRPPGRPLYEAVDCPVNRASGFGSLSWFQVSAFESELDLNWVFFYLLFL